MDDEIAYRPIKDSTGDHVAVEFGTGRYRLTRAEFDRLIWPLMLDMEREAWRSRGHVVKFR